MATPMQEEDSPHDIDFDDVPTTVECHPSQNLLASGLVSGDVLIHSFSTTEGNTFVRKFGHHKKSCRALRFSADGKRLYSVSKDKSIICVDVETGRLKKRIRKAHESSINSLSLTGPHFLATGDDDGVLKVWDMRTKEATMELKECEDYISDMILDDDKKLLIASSGEGTLTTFNIRRKRMELQSELFDAELLCLAKMKSGRKLVCGTSEGVINVFNWGQWGNISDRFPCGEEQINCVVPISENILCAGTDDGNIRAVHILPNRILGVVGQHSEEFPVESLSLTADNSCIVSCSHDQKVKFWNVEEVKRQTVDTSKGGRKKGKKLVKFGKAKKNDFFAGLVKNEDQQGGGDDNDGSDDDSDSDSD